MIILDNTTLIQHEHLIVIDNRLQPMSNGDNGTLLELTKRLLDLSISPVVDGGGGFVHHEHAGILEEGTGETEKLPLALGEVGAVFGDGAV